MINGTTMSGRQVWWLACKRTFSDPRDDSTLHYLDLFTLQLEDCKGKVHKFLSAWNRCLTQVEEPPKEAVLEAVLKRQLIKSVELKKPLDMYDICFPEGNYHVLMKITVEHLERVRVNAWRERKWDRSRVTYGLVGGSASEPESGQEGCGEHSDFEDEEQALAARGKGKGKGNNSAPVPTGCCRTFWETGKCGKSDCPWTHRANPELRERPKGRGRSVSPRSGRRYSPGKTTRYSPGGTRYSPKGRRLSKGGRTQFSPGGRKYSREKKPARRTRHTRSPRSRGHAAHEDLEQAHAAPTKPNYTGTAPNGNKNAPPCRDYLRHSCTKGNTCNKWHPPECRFFAKGSCRDGDKCSWLHPASGAVGNDNNHHRAGGTPPPGPRIKSPKSKGKAKGDAKAKANVGTHPAEDAAAEENTEAEGYIDSDGYEYEVPGFHE